MTEHDDQGVVLFIPFDFVELPSSVIVDARDEFMQTLYKLWLDAIFCLVSESNYLGLYMYTISKLAKEANVGVETIRFYEKKALLQQPIKPSQGYRQYTPQALSRVLFIKRAQLLGFTLAEISSLLVLSNSNCEEVQSLAEHKLDVIEEKLKDLTRLKGSLQSLISDCKNNTNEKACPIIQSLQPEKK